MHPTPQAQRSTWSGPEQAVRARPPGRDPWGEPMGPVGARAKSAAHTADHEPITSTRCVSNRPAPLSDRHKGHMAGMAGDGRRAR